MRSSRRARWCALILAGGVLAAGCSSESGGAGTASTPPSATTSAAATDSGAVDRVARIAVLTPQKGELAEAGRGVREAVRLAVDEVNAAGNVPGWSFEAVFGSDVSTQSAGQQAASGLVETEALVGVVGGLRSTIDEGVAPVLNSRGIPMIGPAATSPQLTVRVAGGEVVRPFPTYFRLAPREADQGRAAARFLVRDLGAERAAVVIDGTSYGRRLGRAFQAQARADELRVGVRRTLRLPADLTTPVAEQRVRRTVAAIRRGTIDAVFVGGSAGTASALGDALRATGAGVPLVGGDALFAPEFLDRDEDAILDGDYAVFPGARADELATAAGFVRRFTAAEPEGDPGPFGANAYDAARALMRAFGAVVGTRTEVTPAVHAGMVATLDGIRFRGATGMVEFDEQGDALDAPSSLYRVTDGDWSPVAVVRVGGAERRNVALGFARD